MKTGVSSAPIILLAVVSSLFTGDVEAIKGWDTNAGLTVQTIFTDNVDLTKNNKKSDMGVRITPGIGIRRDTRYNKLNFQYGLGYTQHFSSQEESDFSHNLTAVWQSELQRDWLFLDVNLNAFQSLISASGANSGDDFNNTGNTTQTFTYSISPYTKHHLGGFADLELRYTNDGVFLDTNSAGDSSSNGISFQLSSGRNFQILSWNVNGSYRQVDRDESGAGDTYSKVHASVNYRLNRNWAPFLYVSYQDNEYETNSDNPSGVAYGGGVTWTPNRELSLQLSHNSEGAAFGGKLTWKPNIRTTVDLSYGDDPYHEDWAFNLSHRQRRSTLKASYSVNHISSARDELLQRQTFQLVDNFGNPILDPITGQPILIPLDNPNLSDETYTLSRFSLGYDILVGKHDNISFEGTFSNRDYQVSLEEEETWGLNARWSHYVRANLSTNLGINWEQSNNKSTGEETTQWRLNTGLNYQLGSKTTLGLDLYHVENQASDNTSEYAENRITLTLGTHW